MNQKNSRNLMIATLLFSGFLSLFNETILNVALTKIMTSMQVSATTVQWLSTGYVLVVAIMVPTSAYFIETFPLKKLFLGAMSFFLLGTILASVAPVFSFLLIARMVQAIGTGLLAPMMINACLAVTPLEKQGFTMSLCTGTILVGPAVGPIVSGLVLQFFSWRSLFYLMIPLAVLCMLLGYLFVDLSQTKSTEKADLFSIGLSAGGFALLVYGMDIVSNPEFSWLLKVFLLLAGFGLLGLFCRRQLQLVKPMLDIRIFAKKVFLLGALLVIIIQMVQFSMNILLPMIFESGMGLSSLTAALALLPAVLCCSLMTLAVGHLYDQQGGAKLIPLGLGVMMIAVIMMTVITESSSLLVICSINILIYLGISFAWSPVQSSALASLSAEEKTHGVAIINTFVQLGSALGTPLFIGLMSSKKQMLMTKGTSENLALYAGFRYAMTVGAVILLVGFGVALLISRFLKEDTTQQITI